MKMKDLFVYIMLLTLAATVVTGCDKVFQASSDTAEQVDAVVEKSDEGTTSVTDPDDQPQAEATEDNRTEKEEEADSSN